MTPNYQIKYTKEFKKSIKKLTNQGKNIDKLLNIVDKLSIKKGSIGNKIS